MQEIGKLFGPTPFRFRHHHLPSSRPSEIGSKDGGLRLVSETAIFGPPQQVELPDGTIALLQGTDLDSRPFADPDLDVPTSIAVFTDLANFSSPQEWKQFNDEVEDLSSTAIERKLIARKSVISPPEIVFLLGALLPVALAIKVFLKKLTKDEDDKSFLEQLLQKTGDKLSTTIAEDIDKFYRVVRSAAWTGVKRFTRSERPTTYVIQVPPAIPGIPVISFVIVTSDPAKVEEMTRWERLEAALAGAEELTDRFGARELHYMLDASDNWQFNYLLTGDGKVVGKRHGFARRAHTVKLMRKYKEHGTLPDHSALASQSESYNSVDEYADLEFLMQAGQAVSFGGTVSNHAPVDLMNEESPVIRQQRC